MKVYSYNDITIENNINIIFLCGVKFRNNSSNDKRKILKLFLESNPLNKVIILEENFTLRKMNERTLVYSDTGLNNLFQIEKLTAILADSIFIIHESLSTAAELGVFASNMRLIDRICLITPDSLNIEENKVGGFIQLAFFNREINVKNITFYPQVVVNKISKNRKGYHTQFSNNQISNQLGSKINKFVFDTQQPDVGICFRKNNYLNFIEGTNTYFINVKQRKCTILLDIYTIKYQIIALFSIKEFRDTIIKTTSVEQSILETEAFYKKVLADTIIKKEISVDNNYNFIYKIGDREHYNTQVKAVIGYILYILHAMKFIIIPRQSKSERFTIRRNFKDIYDKFAKVVDIDEDIDFIGEL